jgi:hypothetical protein
MKWLYAGPCHEVKEHLILGFEVTEIHSCSETSVERRVVSHSFRKQTVREGGGVATQWILYSGSHGNSQCMLKGKVGDSFYRRYGVPAATSCIIGYSESRQLPLSLMWGVTVDDPESIHWPIKDSICIKRANSGKNLLWAYLTVFS